MNVKDIRELFLKYFENNDHVIFKESPLSIENDESLFFTNSGMAQFKDIFLGYKSTKYKNITTAQKCIRIGGKHDDLENIGKSKHHNTLFEMLGNFSFSNKTKEDTIQLAWNFLINVLNLEKKKIKITIHEHDKDTFEIWKNRIKIKRDNIIIGNDISNFWSMDEVGPCGFCSEIFYNIGKDKENLLEIWNLVFIEHYKNKSKKFLKLKSSHIDTGMGLERIASILQNVFDNYKIDTHFPLIKKTIKFFGIESIDINKEIKIIVDHLRTCIFLINEGIVPSNEGKGYVIKKLIRRAILNKNKLNKKYNLHDIIPDYISIINNTYFKYNYDIKTIKQIIKVEEEKFNITINLGKKYVKKLLDKNKKLDSKNMFILYDTYGLPLDIIKNITKSYKIEINIDNLKKEIYKHKNINRKIKQHNKLIYYDISRDLINTEFAGYKKLRCKSKVIKIIIDNEEKNYISENQNGLIIVDKTTFFSEKGGQVGDIGLIKNNNNVFEVKNTTEIRKIYIHYGIISSGKIKINDVVEMIVDKNFRYDISNNHTATHLLNATLINVLGKHTKQVGSTIKHNYLTFDFIHYVSLKEEEILKIENIINRHICNNKKIKINILEFKTADKLFNLSKINKIDEKIRVTNIGNNISKELCAGTHAKYTGELEIFKIIKEYGVGNNIRRIEAITGKYTKFYIKEIEKKINNIKKILKTNSKDIDFILKNLIKENKTLKIENNKLNLKILEFLIKNSKKIYTKKNIKLITINMNKLNTNLFKKIVNNYENTIFILNTDVKNLFILHVTKKLNLNLENIINCLKQKIKVNYKTQTNIAHLLTSDYYDINRLLNDISNYINNV